jgi:hypothetical protein
MNPSVALRFTRSGIAIAFVVLAAQARGQGQPAMIPTAVAQATSLNTQMLGPTRYFVGRTPPGWPAALVPVGANIVGGAMIGDAAMFRMRTAVFEFAGTNDPKIAMRDLVARAGFAARSLAPQSRGGVSGGFAESGPPPDDMGYCNGDEYVMFGAVDSTESTRVFAVNFIDGVAGRSNCSAQRDMMGSGPRVSVPPLTSPSGTKSFNGGGGWSGNSGNTRMTLMTTLGVDSVLNHYTAQLVSGGWKVEGKAGVGSEVAVQAFSFGDRDGQWAATLLVTAIAERREVLLTYLRRD